jgi:hypothetical protein
MIVKKNPCMPGRCSSIIQAEDALASIGARLWAFTRSTVEEHKYRKLQPIPPDAVIKLDIIKGDLPSLEGSIRQIPKPINFQILSARAINHRRSHYKPQN